MFDLVKKQNEDGKGNTNSLKFWRAVDKKNLIPDRSAQSLKTAYRKFCQDATPEKFLKRAMLGEDGKRFRWSHKEEDPPIFGAGYKESESKTVAGTDEKEADTKPFEENKADSDEEEEVEENSEMEFLLACDDLESVISYNVNANPDKQSYSLKEKMEQRQLNDLFTPKEVKRVKVSEEESKSGNVKIDSETILDMESLDQHLKASGKIEITINPEKPNKRTIKSQRKLEERQKNKGDFYKKLSKELHKLAREYKKDMDVVHMLFMEVSCDLEALKKVLAGDAKKQKWSMLEDLAI